MGQKRKSDWSDTDKESPLVEKQCNILEQYGDSADNHYQSHCRFSQLNRSKIKGKDTKSNTTQYNQLKKANSDYV